MSRDQAVSCRDDQYVEIILAPLRKSAAYLPKMGGSGEVDLEAFTGLYGADPLYHWMGLDSPLMFAAHKAAGGMTSIYRQLGIGSERLFRQVLRDQLSLDADEVTWSYEILPEPDVEGAPRGAKARVLSLDGRVSLEDVDDSTARDRMKGWIDAQRTDHHDMWQHFQAITPQVKAGGRVSYIIGNSTFYKHEVPAHEWYATMLHELEYRDVKIDVIRKRNSNKALFEYEVTGRRP